MLNPEPKHLGRLKDAKHVIGIISEWHTDETLDVSPEIGGSVKEDVGVSSIWTLGGQAYKGKMDLPNKGGVLGMTEF